MKKVMEYPIFIRGKRLDLCPLAPTDKERLCVLINNPATKKYLGNMMPMTIMHEENWIHSLVTRDDIILALRVKPEDNHKEPLLIGTMGIHRINWLDRTATTGAFIGDEGFLGKGYGTEAKMVLLHYAFETLGLRKIYSEVGAFNERSRKYSEKCGYEHEATLKEDIFRMGKYWDRWILSVRQNTWKPKWDTYRQEYLADIYPE